MVCVHPVCFLYLGMLLSYVFFFFFFQAEDGIRDPLVTGVQTCALPISALGAALRAQRPVPVPVNSPNPGIPAPTAVVMQHDGDILRTCLPTRAPPGQRSEERRVGKECRSRRSQ